MLRQPLFQAMSDCNITYKSKYYELYHVEHRLYIKVLQDWVSTRKASMTALDKARYFLYKRQKGVKLGTKASMVPISQSLEKLRVQAPKYSASWELAALYYEIPKDIVS
jgi:hypothetical protein